MNDGTPYQNTMYEMQILLTPNVDGWVAAEVGLELLLQVVVNGKKWRYQTADGTTTDLPREIHPV